MFVMIVGQGNPESLTRGEHGVWWSDQAPHIHKWLMTTYALKPDPFRIVRHPIDAAVLDQLIQAFPQCQIARELTRLCRKSLRKGTTLSYYTEIFRNYKLQ